MRTLCVSGTHTAKDTLSPGLVWETMLLVIGGILLICSQDGAKQDMSEVVLRDWTLKLWQWSTFSHWVFISSSMCLSVLFYVPVLHFLSDLKVSELKKCLKISKKFKRHSEPWDRLCALMDTLDTLHPFNAQGSNMFVSVGTCRLVWHTGSHKHT